MGFDFIMWDVVEEHLDEAAFLFEKWTDALDSPRYRFDELAERPEARLFAHLDGLRAGGEAVRERLLMPLIGDPSVDQSAAFVAAFLLLEGGHEQACAPILATLDDADLSDEDGLAHWRALVRALELTRLRGLAARLRWGLEAASPAGLAARVRGLACHATKVDARVLEWLRAETPELVRAACRLARRCAEPSLFAGLGPLLRHEDLGLQREALDAACVSCPTQVWPEIRARAMDPSAPLHDRARTWAALLGDASVHTQLVHGTDPDPAQLRALSYCGRAQAVELALTALDDETLGAAAGELIQTITDIPTSDEYWTWLSFAEGEDEDEDEDEPPEPEQDLDADELAALVQGDAELPRPRVEPIRAWWSEARGRFETGGRYVAGVPLHQRGLLTTALARLSCRQRHALGLELSARTQAHARLDTRAFSPTQREQLAALPALQFASGLR